MAEKKNQKIVIWILIAILAVAIGFLYLNFDYLTRSPFDTVVEFDEPDYAAINKDGYKAVIDSYGSRVLVLSPENEINAMIEYSPLSTNSPRSASCLAMDDSRIYILDSIMNPDGVSSEGERVLTYDFNGKFLGTVISTSSEDDEASTDQDAGDGYDYKMISIACDSNRIYAACADKEDNSAVIVADITDGAFKPIHEYLCTEGVPFEFTYQPQLDVTTVITNDGQICSWGFGDDLTYRIPGQIDKLLYRNADEAIALDVNDNTISWLSHPQSQKLIASTAAESFDMCGDELIFADPNEYSVRTYDLDTEEMTCISKMAYKTKIRVIGYITWLMVIVAVGILIALIAQLVKWGKGKREEQKAVAPYGPKRMTMGRLYGNAFLIMIIAFAITAFSIGRFYYNNAMDKARADVIGTAFRIKMTSSDGFGDDLAAIESQEDYGTPEYEAVCSFLDTMCLRDAPADPRTEMTSTVYRFMDGTDAVSMVIDPQDYNRIGTIYDTRDQERKQIKDGLDYVREGYYNEAIVKYNNGVRLYQIYAPVYDSAEKIVGATVVAFNESGINEELKMALATRLLEIFTLLAGLCMLVAEIRYGLSVVKIQRERHRKEIFNTTIVEADRTVNIMLLIPSSIYESFYTLMVFEILRNSGSANSAFLLALAITIQGIAFALVWTVRFSIVKHDPKKFMYLSMVITIVGLCASIVASKYNSYALIVIGGAIVCCGFALSGGSGKTIKLSGKKPAEEYYNMVFAGVELSIAYAIGAAIGSVVRGMYGDTGLILLAIVMSLAAIPIVWYFVGDDIAVPRSVYDKDENRKPSLFNVLKKNARVLLRPKLLMALFLLTLPISFLDQFSFYVLPLLKEYEGLPDVVIGAVTLVIKLVTLFVAPSVVKMVSKMGATRTYVTAFAMGITAVVLLVFGADGTMKTFVVALLVIALLCAIVPNIVDDFYIEEARKSGVVVNDIMVIYGAVEGMGSYAGPMVLSYMMLSGISNLGYWWGIICAISAILIVLITKICLPGSNEADKVQKANLASNGENGTV